MAKKCSAISDLHISLAGLRKLRPTELLAIDGPRFIMREVVPGNETLAVLISHDKWRTLNHNMPEVDPHKAKVFYVGDNLYMTIPISAIMVGSAVCEPQARPETGFKITRTRKRGVR